MSTKKISPARTLLMLAVTSSFALSACGNGTEGGDGAGANEAAAGSQDETFTLRLAHTNTPTSIWQEAALETEANIEERTGGRVQVEIYPAGQLGSTEDVLEQAANGTNVASITTASGLSDLSMQEFSILGGPFLFENLEAQERFVESELFQGWLDQLEEDANLTSLAMNYFPGARHMVGNAAYPEPSDLENVLVRTPAVETWTQTFELLGAVPTTIDNTEAYSALEQGVVEASESPLAGIKSNHWNEVSTDITLTGHFRQVQGYVMNAGLFESYPADIQQILTEEFHNSGVFVTQQHVAEENSLRQEFESQGIAFYDANQDAYAAATLEFYDTYNEELLTSVRAAMN